jgi:hypothetical protein
VQNQCLNEAMEMFEDGAMSGTTKGITAAASGGQNSRRCPSDLERLEESFSSVLGFEIEGVFSLPVSIQDLIV